MSNLQPLKWVDASGVDGVYSEKTDSYIKDALCFCSTLVAECVIRKIKDFQAIEGLFYCLLFSVSM